MRVIGVCRFSYPALGGFKRMHDTIEEREAYLYASDRMELRFAHFEALVLPSIGAQTDREFTFLIVIGERMPEPYLTRLYDLCATVPQIKIVQRPPQKHRLAMQLAIQHELGANEEDTIQFRLDDDDAMGVDFVAQCRSIARRSSRLRRREPRMVIEFNSGYSARLSAEGITAEPVITQFWACGLGVTFPAGDTRTVMNYGHHKLHHSMPAVIHPRPPMYIRAKHDDNDSAAKFKTGPLKPLDDAGRQLFRDRFNVEEAEICRIFANPALLRGKG
ncbi:riboflavin synthase subunit beta [Pseudohalocynthiibacter aestuariivivens]|uniref:Rhamnosyl transferase n=1 Tax=Roseovarius pelagicus TaxID=2980108 RepID=A0ABY6DE57_9RHOB|nr:MULTISPECIES: glycosyltransferase [Rhodobacterales]QIE47013.1 riboflavin synthase subunit beta [Pseudohalocynthiibacter aestuariivivens]UXX84437.1 putative rhamnosyl transferase [Roseovarius pelagicus]